ncbi:MAG: GAF domain-containing protein, partial [Chloroflexi bacterium]|nr:GAF domain-containing protein [Chloroflexota bacterium]
MLRPKQRSNQIFAAYMLMLSVNSYSILIANTATDIVTVYEASRFHTLAIMIATPLLWTLYLELFVPQLRLTRLVTPLFIILAILPLVGGLIDWVSDSTLLFVFEPELYSGGYVQASKTLNGRFGSIFYQIYFITLNSLLLIPIFFFAFTQIVPKRLQRAARILLMFSLSVGFLYLPFVDIPLTLRSMLAPTLAALGAAWIVNSYHLFSPVELAMKEVLNTVSAGLLVFDERFILTDANVISSKLLPINLTEDILALSLSQLLQRMMPNANDQEELIRLEKAVQLNPEKVHSQEIVMQDGRSSQNPITTWLKFNFCPVYGDRHALLGLSCSVEDLTVERRTQTYIAEAHQTIEQYAYNQAVLNDITRATVSALDFNEILLTLATQLVALFKAENCYITLIDERSQQPVPAMAYGVNVDTYLSLRLDPGEQSISREVCRLGHTILVEDCHNSDYVSQRIGQKFPTRGMMALPMLADGKVFGALQIGFNKRRTFSNEEVKLGEQVSQQVALAIYKNRLLKAEKEQRELLEALQAAGQTLTSTLDFEQVLDRILDEIARVIPYDTASFALIENENVRIVRSRGFHIHSPLTNAEITQISFDIDQTPTFRTMYETKRPFCIPNTTNSPEWKHFEIVNHIKSWLGIPLLVADEVVAFLSVDKLEVDFYQEYYEERLVAFASQAAVALQHAQLFTEIQRRVTELEALSVVSAALQSTKSLSDILQSVLGKMVAILSARVGVAFLLNDEKTAVISQASYPNQFYPDGIRYSLGEGITGKVAASGEIHISANPSLDPLRKQRAGEPEAIEQLQTTIALPLKSEEGILGIIHIGLDTIYEFADDEIRTLKAICNIVANGLQRIQVMQTLEARVANRTYDLEKANERLQELDKLKTKFIADVSHELRTPVANLAIYINLLQNGKPEKQEHYRNVLQQQADRLTNLVEAILGL